MYNLKVAEMKAKTTLHFYVKSTKASSGGLFPIYVLLIVDGKRNEYSSKKFIQPSKWPNELSRMKGNLEEVRSINNLPRTRSISSLNNIVNSCKPSNK